MAAYLLSGYGRGTVARFSRKIKRLNAIDIERAESLKLRISEVFVKNVTSKTQTVNVLWDRIRQMEAERGFEGREYPAGMCPFPFRLTGQGFFPGGDGLWRNESELALASSGELPSDGVMFFGNDFGTLSSYGKLKIKGYENPLTWKHIKQRVRDAGIPPKLTFFTNTVLGLREGGTALDKKDWQKMPGFADFCRRFLVDQVETLRPKLVVVLGPPSRASFESLARLYPIIADDCHG